MYILTYSLDADTGLTLTPKYVDETGSVGATVSSANNFEITGWYGFTLIVNAGYRGYIGFFDGSNNLVAMFATNPEEGENLDVKVSTLKSVGPGGISYPVTVLDISNNPIEGAQVWITTDPGGRNTIAGTLISDSTGTVTFELPAGNYFLWRIATGFMFPNPKTITVQ